MQHYNHLRLRRIIERMTEGETLGDIAISMNFSSQSYMTAFFRRQTGVAPRNYLK
jgi:AraC-like DNA-binding protein